MTDELVETIKAAMLKNLSDQGFVTAEDADGFCLIDHTLDLSAFARACLAEIAAAGYVVVPEKPTEAMRNAPELGHFFGGLNVDGLYDEAAEHVWSAMLDASRKV